MQKEPLHFYQVQRLLFEFSMILFYHSSYSPSAFLAAATRLRWNMLSTTAQYLSAKQTMTASRQVGTCRKVKGHMWLEMMLCSFLVMPNTRSALTQA